MEQAPSTSRRTAFWKKIDLSFLGAFILGLLSLSVYLYDGSRSEADLQAMVQSNIRKDFREAVEAATAETEVIAQRYASTRSLASDDGAIRLAFDPGCSLIQWSDAESMPSSRIIRDLCSYPARRTLQDRNKVWYYLRMVKDDITFVTLIPVLVRHKVDNAYLKPYIFLGRYNRDYDVAANMRSFNVHMKQIPEAINIFDAGENFVFCLVVPDLSVFTWRLKFWVLLMAFLAICLAAVGVYRRVRGRKVVLGPLRVSGTLLFVLGLLGLRVLIFQLDLPNAYRPMELFSPTVLAIGEWSPSLGDLGLNVSFVLISIYLLMREYRRRVSLFYKWALQNETIAWTVQCFVLTVCGLFAKAFFDLAEDIIQHSTIYFEFSDVFKLDFYSYLGFGVLAAVLMALQLILQELLRFSFHFFVGPGRWVKVALSVAWLGALSFFLFGADLAYLISVPIVFGMSLLIFIRTRRKLVFRLDLLNFLLVISIFSLLTTVGLVKGSNYRNHVEMEQIADRQSDTHDLITESLFERVVREIEAESFVLDYIDAEGISSRLKERFFESNFKGYAVRIFVYDENANLLDKTGDYQPYLLPDSDPSLQQMGKETMTDNLYLVRYYQGIFESIYIGEFNLLLRSLGNILVWVELEPTEIAPNRLYPQLLLDDNIRTKAVISDQFDYAIYKDGRLFRKHSDLPYPIFYEGPPQLDSLRYVYDQGRTFNNLYYKPSEEKVVHVRTPRRSLFDAINVFSFIFYFFILAGILLTTPVWLLRFIKKPSSIRNLTLKSKIQAFFLSISVLPLFVVVFLLSPYIRDHIYADLKSDLQVRTQQIASQIREEYLLLRKNRAGYKELLAVVKKKLSDMEKALYNDINIYYSNGELHMTTQPSIYELGLHSEYMNQAVYDQIRRGVISDVVIEDKIGDITYFSGFAPIMSDDRRVVGFMNIPYFKNQDQVNQQSLSLLTLLVNIYVFIFLAIGIIAVLISNSIIRPLGLLSQKLEATNLGRANEPIEWNTQDEIGDIIRAYNQMLRKLAESEEKLARTERETAWKEMASQVAHEIKNPLTPMRLSVQHLVRTWNGDKPENEKLNKMFEKVTKTILVQIESLVNIANSFSQFAKMPEPQRSTFSLPAVVQEVAELYSHSETVQLKLDIPDAEFLIHSDRDQLSRVFNNLVKNANQAIDHDQGVVEVRLEIEGDTAKVIVTDNGKGIPEEIASRIFEPKFSTKSSGMGLGLAIVKKIIEGAGGRIYFESEVGEGTRFFVELPRAEQEA